MASVADLEVTQEYQERAETDAEKVDDSGQFSSRWAFWLSAIGCSVGFGNLWRFPYLVYEHGGLAFFIPYILALFLVVIPVSFLEFGIGQLSQGGNVKAYRAIHARVACVGWGFWTSANILQFYPLLLSWSLMYFANSFKKDMPWLTSKDEEVFCKAQVSQVTCETNVACSWLDSDTCDAQILNKAIYFFKNGVSAKDEYWEGIKTFNGYILLCEFISWSLIFLATVGGAKILGYINYFTTTAPAIFLMVLVAVGASLDGAIDGIKVYIAKFNGDELMNATVWTAALGQALFSMGATQGTMTAYAAHNKRDQNFVQDTYVVAFGDTFFAFIAGFAVFSVIGYLSNSSKVPIPDLPLSGTGLAFQTYPVGLGAGVPAPGSQIFSVMFFLTLWLLGMSTSIGLLEAICLIWTESNFYKSCTRLQRWHAYAVGCVIFFTVAFIYSTDMGVHLLDCLDHFTNNVGFIFICGCEAISAGWFSAWDLYHEKVGSRAVYVHMSTWIVGCAFSSLLGFVLPTKIGRIVGPVFGVVIMGGGFIAGIVLTKKEGPGGYRYTFSERLYNLTFYNVNQLRMYMNDAACRNTSWRIPRVWMVSMKYLTPVMTTLLFFSTVTNPDTMYRLPGGKNGKNGAYPWWVFLLGSVGPYFVIAGTVLFFFVPRWMHWLWPAESVVFEYADESAEDRLGKIRDKVNDLRSRVTAREDGGSFSHSRDNNSSRYSLD